ncbi:MAG TPA: hypothetical protein VF014_11690 [Casimicrobiaceae bacterium]|nr:hypothetical protein [Casimicrobiaceae bacterium]
MNVLELRKIIIVGFSVDAPDGPPLLGPNGLPIVLAAEYPVKLRVAFWIPMPAPHKRSEGKSEVIDPRAFELQALRDGAIEEHVQEFDFPKQPSLDEARARLMPVWEGLTAHSLGILPNGAPQDRGTKPVIQFTQSD